MLVLSLFKALKSSHITPIPSCLHWLRTTERIEYNSSPLPTKFSQVTITQPPCLQSLISGQRLRTTRSLSVVTLARPINSSFLKITDRSFRYASPCLWNQLPLSFRQPHSAHQFLQFRLTYSFTHHFFLFLFTTLLIHNSLPLSLPA